MRSGNDLNAQEMMKWTKIFDRKFVSKSLNKGVQEGVGIAGEHNVINVDE